MRPNRASDRNVLKSARLVCLDNYTKKGDGCIGVEKLFIFIKFEFEVIDRLTLSP